jgi:hypothetical protein
MRDAARVRGFAVETAAMDRGYDIERVYADCAERGPCLLALASPLRGRGPFRSQRKTREKSLSSLADRAGLRVRAFHVLLCGRCRRAQAGRPRCQRRPRRPRRWRRLAPRSDLISRSVPFRQSFRQALLGGGNARRVPCPQYALADGAAVRPALPRPRVPGVRLAQLPEADSSSAGIYGCDVDSAGDVQSVRRLECVECHRVSRDDERGWTARLTVDDQVAVFWPEVR